jgi:hypothetical protein
MPTSTTPGSSTRRKLIAIVVVAVLLAVLLLQPGLDTLHSSNERTPTVVIASPSSSPRGDDEVSGEGGDVEIVAPGNGAPPLAAFVNVDPPFTYRPTASHDPAELEQVVEAAVARCRRVQGPEQRHEPCLLLRDVVLTNRMTVIVPADRNADFVALLGPGRTKAKFPLNGAETRTHLRSLDVEVVPSVDSLPPAPVRCPTTLAYYGLPVSGAEAFKNVWHVIADYYLTLHHTLAGVVDAQASITWYTLTPLWVKKTPDTHACHTVGACRRERPLFEAFFRLFGGRVEYINDGFSAGAAEDQRASSVRVDYLMLGINYRCSAIPDEGMDTPECQSALRGARQSLLRDMQLPVDRVVSAAELRCPAVHIVSRQRAYYRKIWPWDEFLAAVRGVLRTRGCADADALVRVYDFSSSVSLYTQLKSVANSTVVIAGRGAGTSWVAWLPDGGGYLSVSGRDRWQPYRQLIPSWVTFHHTTVAMVHHENPYRKPLKFFKPPKIDANRVGYLVDPSRIAKDLEELLKTMEERSTSR